jgi:LytS/YehU family sensor histidine kinase
MLQLQVEDDVGSADAAPTPATAGHGMALANLRERLRTHYGQRAGLVLEPLPTGMRATLHLPLD